MSVTIHQRPEDYTPYRNDQTFVALSTQVAISDFQYVVDCEDELTAESETFYIKQRPVNGRLTFPAHIFVQKFIQHYVPNNLYGWQICEDAIRRINLEFKEYYSAALHAGSPPVLEDYIIWNGALRALEWVQYDPNDFVYNSAASPPNRVYISSYNYDGFTPRYKLNNAAYEDKSSFIYVLNNPAGAITNIRVVCYDSDDNEIQNSIIQNPFSGNPDYNDHYICIDVGRKGLDKIDSGDVSGSYPIIPINCAYYEIEDIDIIGDEPPFTYVVNNVIQRLIISCEPTFPVYTLHYLGRFGNFETLHFNKNSELREAAEKSTYRVNPNTLVVNTYSYSEFDAWEKTLSSTGTETYVLNSDWLTEAQVAAHREIITSPLVYMDMGSTIGLVPVKVLNGDILVNKEHNNKLFGITLNIEPTYKNNYQIG